MQYFIGGFWLSVESLVFTLKSTELSRTVFAEHRRSQLSKTLICVNFPSLLAEPPSAQSCFFFFLAAPGTLAEPLSSPVIISPGQETHLSCRSAVNKVLSRSPSPCKPLCKASRPEGRLAQWLSKTPNTTQAEVRRLSERFETEPMRSSFSSSVVLRATSR